MTLPYVAGTSERIARILRARDVAVSYRPVSKLRDLVSRPKDPIPPMARRNVVYRIPCSECDAVYIGETGRRLQTRLGEHKDAMRRGQSHHSGAVEHACLTGHALDFDNTRILSHQENWFARKFREGVEIKRHDSTMNRDQGVEVPPQYSALL